MWILAGSVTSLLWSNSRIISKIGNLGIDGTVFYCPFSILLSIFHSFTLSRHCHSTDEYQSTEEYFCPVNLGMLCVNWVKIWLKIKWILYGMCTNEGWEIDLPQFQKWRVVFLPSFGGLITCLFVNPKYVAGVAVLTSEITRKLLHSQDWSHSRSLQHYRAWWERLVSSYPPPQNLTPFFGLLGIAACWSPKLGV